MFLTKRRLEFAAASLVVLAALVAMTIRDLLTPSESAVLFALWVAVGILVALHRGLRSLRADVERRMERLEGTVKRRFHRQTSAIHADFEASRQLLEGVHERTAARLARLELAIDDAADTARTTIEEQAQTTEQLLQSTIGLQTVMRSQPLPPMRAWSGFADLQSYLYRLVRAIEPALVVECGSGVSTVVIATALAEIGHGSLVSLDHDDWYANRTRSWLIARGLDSYAEVLTAPLGTQALTPGNPWYSHTWLDQDTPRIDLLFVDGPPGATAERARYPAVPLLREQLQEHCIVVLDDVSRHDERRVLEAWDDLLPDHESMVLPHVKGTGILFPRDRGSVAPWID